MKPAPEPVIAVVGRPTWASRPVQPLTRRASDRGRLRGLTRDRHYVTPPGRSEFIVVDTGLEPTARRHCQGNGQRRARPWPKPMRDFVVDIRRGLCARPRHRALSALGQQKVFLRRTKRGHGRFTLLGELYECAWASSPDLLTHGRASEADRCGAGASSPKQAEPTLRTRPPLAVAGRPNVGKSTLITLAGRRGLVAFDQPGTTRDRSPCFRAPRAEVRVIDTAGLPQGQVFEAIEKFSVVKTRCDRQRRRGAALADATKVTEQAHTSPATSWKVVVPWCWPSTNGTR